MVKNGLVILFAGLIVALPFLFQQRQQLTDWRPGDPELVVVTPNNEAIRFEFGHAFSRWHQQHYGKPVKVDWRLRRDGSKFKIADGEDLRRHIEAAGVDQTILCSDLGQVGTMSPLEGFRQGIRLCMDLGYDDEQIRKMVSLNTARALGIEADLPTLQ